MRAKEVNLDKHPVRRVSSEQQSAEEAVWVAFCRYLEWQPDGDWDTFLSFVDDEGGVRPPKTSDPRCRWHPTEKAGSCIVCDPRPTE